MRNGEGLQQQREINPDRQFAQANEKLVESTGALQTALARANMDSLPPSIKESLDRIEQMLQPHAVQ